MDTWNLTPTEAAIMAAMVDDEVCTSEALAEMFGVERVTISAHLRNIFTKARIYPGCRTLLVIRYMKGDG